MKQTAMQEMIKKLEEKRDMWEADGKLSDRQIRGTYVIAILVAKELLEMEEQQIIDAFKRGLINEMNGIEEITSKQYYNQQFKNK